MDQSTSALSNRAMSAFPCSIGTSLALESFATGTQAPYDPDRVIPQKVTLSDYDVFYCCLMTLYRNIAGSVEKNAWAHVSPGDVVETIEFEVDLIKRLVQELTFGKTKVVFYASNYKGLAHKYPHAKLRVDSTPKQKEYSAFMQLVMNAYIKRQAKSDDIKLFDLELQPKERVKGLILTHYAYDLLSQTAFTELDLIESHTGILKKSSQFNSKMTNGKYLMRIPFTSYWLQVFGDSTLFYQFPIKVRNEVLNTADRYNWTVVTTKERMRLGIEQMKDPFTKAILLDMMKED